MSASSYPGTGPRCRCGCEYLYGLVLLPLVLTTYAGGVDLAGSTVRELPVESLTCKACGRHTITRDLPPIGIDVAAVLEKLAAEEAGRPSVRAGATLPRCTCGSEDLSWSAVVALTVHTAGSTMLGEVSRSMAATPAGTLACGACRRAWDGIREDLPGQVQAAVDTFRAALTRGEVRIGE